MENYTHTAAATKRVGVWIRVSTDEQAQGDSPKHHEVRGRSYAQAKGWEVREVYNLSGFSGKSVIDYPETKRMMEDIRRGHISGLIFSKLARFARNTVELLKFSDFFQEHDADLISLQEAIDTSTPAGRLFFTVNAALAQFEREEIASRVSASVPVRAKLGKPLGGKGPYGYAWKDKALVVDPSTAPIRKMMYELFAETRRIGTVAQILNERGYRTRGGALWTDTTVRRIIECPAAKGERLANYTVSHARGKGVGRKSEADWVVQAVEPIVSKELWERCNQMLEDRKVKGGRPARQGKSPLTGFVRCHCGGRMYVLTRSPHWTCRDCKNKVPAADLEALFREEIRGVVLSPERMAEYREASCSELAVKRTTLAPLRQEAAKVSVDADRCFELYDKGALSVEQFRERFQPLDARKRELSREVVRLEVEIAAIENESLSAEHVGDAAKDFYDEWPALSLAERRRVVSLFLRQIVVGKEDMSIELFRLPILEKVAGSQHTLSRSRCATASSPA